MKVEEFIDSLQQDNLDSQLLFSATELSESSFDKVWNKSEDADYDNL